jgi:predicted anti-sigma-YlaC factor YlaD
VETHLAACRVCRDLAAELAEFGAGLRRDPRPVAG